MKKELKTLGKRIAASALAIATAFVLIPFGGKEAKADDTKELTPIETVTITVTPPVAGEKATYETPQYDKNTWEMISGGWSPVIASVGEAVSYEGSYFQYNQSLPSENPNYELNPEETSTITFIEGEYYYFELFVNPKDGYVFSHTTKPNEYGDFEEFDKLTAEIIVEGIDESEWELGWCSESSIAVYGKVKAVAAASTHTVTFETNDGSKVEALEVEDGAKATKPTDPTKEGYTFDGWYSDKELTKAFDFATAITADTTVYAKWTEESTEAPADNGEVSKESPADNAMPTVVSNSVEELKTLVLTDEDIAALEAGEDIKVYFAVTDIASTIDATEKAKVEEATKAASADYSIGAYLDIDLFKQVGDKAAAGVTSTKGKMKVTVTLPESLRGDYTYKAVRVHHATADVLDATYDKTTGNLTFESDQFSTYAIIYKKAEAATTTEATTAATTAAATTTEATTAAKSSPKTGDSALPFVAFAILGLSALAGAYSLKKFAK